MNTFIQKYIVLCFIERDCIFIKKLFRIRILSQLLSRIFELGVIAKMEALMEVRKKYEIGKKD